MNILTLDSSINGQQSFTRKITQAITARLQELHEDEGRGGITAKYRDLVADPVPPLHSPSDLAAPLSSELLEEFLGSDVIVVGAPMYNFTIPSQLKAWLDRIMVAGKTFRYTAEGPQGLASGKRVILALASGGDAPPEGETNFVEPYLRLIFSFIGIDRIEAFHVGKVALGEGGAELEKALQQIRAMPS